MSTSYSDRSRSVDYQACPRSYYYGYVQPNGGPVPGIRPNRIDMNLIVGGGFHEGVNHILEGVGVDEAVGRALEGFGAWGGYWPQVKTHGLILDPAEDASYVAWEQASMVEALIRGYAAFMLPSILERFTVVEAERDESAVFTKKFYQDDGVHVKTDDFNLVWGMRGDALLMDKDTFDLYILSLKTKKEWYGQKDEKQNRYDMQGLSETATVDQRLQRWQKKLENSLAGTGAVNGARPTQVVIDGEPIPQWFVDRFASGASPLVSGVKMEFAIKGRRSEYPKGSGRWTYSNPLIRPWKKSEDLGRGGGYAFMFEVKDDYGVNHRLGKGWNRINIWEDMGVKEWIEYLATREVQGMPAGRGISEQFIAPMEYFRNEEDMARWQRQRLYEEHRMMLGRQAVAAELGRPGYEDALDEHFPMYSNYPTNCTYCEFETVCHGGIKAYVHDPLSSGLFVPRETTNHKAELNAILATTELPVDAGASGPTS